MTGRLHFLLRGRRQVDSCPDIEEFTDHHRRGAVGSDLVLLNLGGLFLDAASLDSWRSWHTSSSACGLPGMKVFGWLKALKSSA